MIRSRLSTAKVQVMYRLLTGNAGPCHPLVASLKVFTIIFALELGLRLRDRDLSVQCKATHIYEESYTNEPNCIVTRVEITLSSRLCAPVRSNVRSVPDGSGA